MSRKALVVGVDYYDNVTPLYGCVNDAHAVKAALDRHGDGTKNFDCNILAASGPNDRLTRSELRTSVRDLFAGEDEIALFYFAGHGYIEQVGGYLLCSDSAEGSDGLSLSELVSFANSSRARNRIIILDSCHSGIAGANHVDSALVTISVGVTILTASTAAQYATEVNGSGLFTSLLIDALNGGAANLLGEVTPGSVYAHIDQSLGAWDKRPLFKTNVTTFSSLKRVQPSISLESLKRIRDYFGAIGEELPLDPSFEPTSTAPNESNTRVFEDLQAMVKVNLVRPVGEDHMYFAAMNSKSCRLTLLGEHYWRLVDSKRI
jgi:Caspase domain